MPDIPEKYFYAIVVILAMWLLDALKILILPKRSLLTDTESDMIERLFTICSAKTDDGTPKVWIPAQVVTNLAMLLEMLKSHQQTMVGYDSSRRHDLQTTSRAVTNMNTEMSALKKQVSTMDKENTISRGAILLAISKISGTQNGH